MQPQWSGEGLLKIPWSLWVKRTSWALTPRVVTKGILWPGMERQLPLAQAQVVGYQPAFLLAQRVLAPFGSWEVRYLLQRLLPRRGGEGSL